VAGVVTRGDHPDLDAETLPNRLLARSPRQLQEA
jgi:hypothetical protein